MLVDSHCHLDFPDYAGSVDAVVERARAAGVGVCVSIGTELARFPGVKAVAEKFPHVWCSVGVHPHEAEMELLDDEAALVTEAAHPKVVAIGETGLDYYYEHAPRLQQQANFRSHISAGRKTGLPVIVHTRDADDDTIAILREEMDKGAFTGLIHCFTGTQVLADAALEMGLYISVSGIATFKNSTALRDVIKTVPLDRLLVETDAPYLAPVPHRGKTNEPAFVVHTAKMLAELKGVTDAELAATTTENFFRLFSKVRRPDA
ncbi:MAG: TatD family hydrolase [Alphaproteobacteria bacterium]|nr:TatD family hydrolase [Alphaproteobacteria bacterium]